MKASIPANDVAVNHPTSKMQKPKSKEPKQDPMINRNVRQRVNVFARERFKVKLLQEIEFDLMGCQLEGWSMGSYVCEIKQLIDDIFQKMTKEMNKTVL